MIISENNSDMRKYLFILSFFLFSSFFTFAQCGPGVPGFNVNLTGNPDSVWTSPNIARNGNCCTSSPPDRCVDFIITLDPGAAGISFNIISGAIPGGALFYQINCGPPQALGSAICLSGVGPHLLTFCKPGTNANVYQITSIPAAVGGADIVVNQGCIDTLHATGFNNSTLTWNSIFPGSPGAYNSLLSCTSGCADPIATGAPGSPPFVDYVVCGIPASMCTFATLCDTVRVTFNPTLAVSIVPINPTICFGATSTVITAVGSGGTLPYNYLWNSVNPSPSITVGAGNYTVMLTDASGCAPVYASVNVTAFAVAITANAGPNNTVCLQSPSVPLSGSVTGASGGIWSGGAGTFSPNNTTLNAVYTPTAAEIAAGSVNLTLTTTGNGTCPAATDVVTISYLGFIGTVAVTPTPVSCFGGTNGSATVSVTGGIPPYTYLWNTVPAQTTATASNLPIGTYTVTIHNGIGCTVTTSVTITQPTPLAVNAVVTNVSCAGGATGVVASTPTGGTSPYTYLWSPGGQTTATISGQTAGTYTLVVTDTKGCTFTSNYTITQPLPLIISSVQTNVSCAGGSNGTAVSTVSGGTLPYSYSWSPSGGTGSTASGLSAGTYTLTVTDGMACTKTIIVTITQPLPLLANTLSTNETCDYLNNGTANVTTSGGTAGYTYSWMPGGMTTPAVASLSSGTYSVTVTDAKGCSVTAFVTITQPLPLTVTLNNISVSCFGGSSGTVSASPSGGSSGYTYSWAAGGATSATVTGVAAGTYTVTVTDANACLVTGTTTVIQPLAPLSNTVLITNVSCAGGSNGTISVTTAGGTPAYTYLWLPGGQTTAGITGQTAGTYSVTVTDLKGCQLTSVYTITQPLPLAISFSHTNVSCFGGSNGTATGTASGGTLPYSYSWSPSGGSGATASGFSAGTYTLTVTDSKGCVFSSSVTITEPPVLIVTTVSVNETCNYLNNGTASATPSGGTPGYTYLWSPGGSTSSNVSFLSSGTYSVTVTDILGCTSSATAVIAESLPLSIVFDTQLNVSCFGGNNGALSATVSGGTPSYSYLWSPGGGTLNMVSGLTAGTYTLSITDYNGCLAQSTATITQPVAPVSAVASSSPATCFGATNGTASAVGSGGTGTYTFLWMPGAMSGSTVAGLGAGTYTVTVTDINGCTGTTTVIVAEPAQIILTTSTINSNCGAPSGQASVIVSGGIPSYTYLWSPSGGTAATATGLFASAYTVIVTDANGCTSTQWANVNDNSGSSATIYAIINVSCNGGSDGSASASVVGGTGPFVYTWSPSGGSSSTATGLSAGSYNVTVVDANGCIANATTSSDITEPPPIVIATTTTAVSCFAGANGTAAVTASGGTPGYTYQWMPMASAGSTVSGLSANTYTVEVTDANGCLQTSAFTIVQPATAVSVSTTAFPVSCFAGTNGSASGSAAGGTTPYSYSWLPGSISGTTISAVAAGTYTITATDQNGCTATSSALVTQPIIVSFTTGSDNASCGTASGVAYIAASGGTPAYSYLWLPGGSVNDSAISLLTGSYSVSITDNNGCTASTNVFVNNDPGPAATISSVTNVNCNGGSDGSATVGVAGGSVPFSYAWSPAGGSAATAAGFSSGSYTVTVTDVNGCISSDTAFITQPIPLVLSVNSVNVTCSAGNNGSATVVAFGGTPGYTYLWLPGGTGGSSVSSLTAGTYTVQVTDTKGCTQQSVFSITEPTAVVASVSGSGNVSCFGGSNGTATVVASGGTPFYSYAWAPSGGSSPVATALPAGSYTVTVSDINGCTGTTSVAITQPAMAVAATATSTAASCFGGANGTATALPSGGTPGYSYLWSPIGGTSSSATGLSNGNYSVLVTDVNGCQTNASVSITEPAVVSGSLFIVNPSCGLSNGLIVSMISGGTGPYTYLWTPGAGVTANISGVGPGAYSLQVTDNAGCVSTYPATLTNIAGPAVSVPVVTNVSCNGGNNGTATANILSGTPPYSLSWAPYGGTGLTGTAFIAGTYTVTVTDALGCTSTATAILNEPSPVGLSVSSLVNVSCNSGANGAITVNGTGGTPSYTYSWSPMSSSSSILTGLSAGSYFATVTDQNSCTASISINIHEPATFLAAFGAVFNPSCFNNSNGSISLLVSGGTIPYSYVWSNGQTGNVAVGLAAGSYSVIVTDANGCTVSLSMILTQPTQIITTAGMNDTICLGSSGTVSALASGGAGGYYYVWQPTSVINAGSYTVTPTSSTTYTVVAYDANGCAGAPATVSAIVYNLTAANIDALALSPICPGQGTVVYATTTGVTGPLTFIWNNGLGSGPGGFLVTPSSPVTYVVSVTNACGGTATDSVSITFNPLPTISLTSDTNSICAPGIIQFFDNSVTGSVTDPIIGWLWNFGDGTTSTLQDPTHIYTSPGTYNVTLTVSTFGGCSNSNTSTPFIVYVYPYPVAAFSQNLTTLDIPYDMLILTNMSTNATIYQWTFGDGSTSTVTNPQYDYTTVGIYPIMLIATSAYGCADTAYSEVTTNVDVVFPNVFTPSTDGPTGGGYDLNSLTNDVFFPYTTGVIEFKFEIFNRWGELIFVSDDINKGWDGYYKEKLCQQDVYVWKAFIKFNNGKKFKKTGDVTLLR